MRHIQKTTSPQSLERWKKANRSKSYADLGREQPTIKSTLRQQLIAEQGYLCCYCETQVEITDSHIEHFRPQAHKRDRNDLDYHNMLISCNNHDSCGERKGSCNSPHLLSPLEAQEIAQLGCDLNGKIIWQDHKGEFTVTTLNLNSKRLIDRRKVLIDIFVSLLKQGEVAQVEEYLTPSSHLNNFYSSIEYLHQKGII